MCGKKCNAVFKSLREWNDHHHCHHPSLTYTCKICGKVCITPSSFRDHKYYHGVKKFECGRCCKQFMNASQLNLHKHFHRRDRLYKCFASKCKHSYKLPQDLLRHINVHLPTVYSCTKCPYSNKQKRLLQQHARSFCLQFGGGLFLLFSALFGITFAIVPEVSITLVMQ